MKRDTNIYFKQTTFFEKNHTDFFLKNMFFFYLVLLHLNNHRWLLLNSEKDHSGKITSSKFPILRVVTTIVYKKTDEWYIKWQRVTTNDNEWYNEWQRVTTSDKEWQRMAMSDSEWEQWYSEPKRHSTVQRMDDCHHFNDKKRYTTTSRDGWLQLEWLNK